MISKLNSKHLDELMNMKCSDWNGDNIKSTLNQQNYHYFGYFKDNKLVAYYCVRIVLDVCELNYILVKKQYRKKGVGKLLIIHLIDFSKSLKCNKIEIEVRKSNDVAIDLYLKDNFEIVGMRKKYYQNPEEDALLMTLFL